MNVWLRLPMHANIEHVARVLFRNRGYGSIRDTDKSKAGTMGVRRGLTEQGKAGVGEAREDGRINRHGWAKLRKGTKVELARNRFHIDWGWQGKPGHRWFGVSGDHGAGSSGSQDEEREGTMKSHCT